MSRQHCLICATDEGLFLDILDEANIRAKLETCLAVKVAKENTPTTKVCHKCTFEIDQCNKFIDKYKQARKTAATTKLNSCSLCLEVDKKGHIFELSKHKYGINDLWQKICNLFEEDFKGKDKKKQSVCLYCRYCIDVLTDLKNVYEESSGRLRNITENGINPADLPKTKTTIVNRKTTILESPNFELHTPSDTDSESSMTRARGRTTSKQVKVSPVKQTLRTCGSCQSSVDNGVDMYRHHSTGLTVCKNCWITADPSSDDIKKKRRAASEEVKQCAVFLKDVLNPHNRPYKIEKDNHGNPVFIITDDSSENESKVKNKTKPSPKLRRDDNIGKIADVTEVKDDRLVDTTEGDKSNVKSKTQKGSTNRKRKDSEQSIQEEIDVETSENENKSKRRPKTQKVTSTDKKERESEQSTQEDIEVVSSDDGSKLKNKVKHVNFEKKKDESGHSTPEEIDIVSSESESSKKKKKGPKSSLSDKKTKESDHSAQEEIDVEEEKPKSRTRGRQTGLNKKKKDSDQSAQEEIDVENSEGETKPKVKTRTNQAINSLNKDKEADIGQVTVDIYSSDENKSKEQVEVAPAKSRGKVKPVRGSKRKDSEKSVQDEKIETKESVNDEGSKASGKQDKKRRDSESHSGQEDIVVDNSDAEADREGTEKVKVNTPDKKGKSKAKSTVPIPRTRKQRKDSEQSINEVIDVDSSDGDGKTENNKKEEEKKEGAKKEDVKEDDEKKEEEKKDEKKEDETKENNKSKGKTKTRKGAVKIVEVEEVDNSDKIKDVGKELKKDNTKESTKSKSKPEKASKLDKKAKEEEQPTHEDIDVEEHEEEKPVRKTRRGALNKKNEVESTEKDKQKVLKEAEPEENCQEDIDIEGIEADNKSKAKKSTKEEITKVVESTNENETKTESKDNKSKKRKDSERSVQEEEETVPARRTRRGVSSNKKESETDMHEESDSSVQKAKRKKVDVKSDIESDSSLARKKRGSVKSDIDSDTGSVRRSRSQAKQTEATPQGKSTRSKRKTSETEATPTVKRGRSSSVESTSSVRKSTRNAKHISEELQNIEEVEESPKEIQPVKKRGKATKANEIESDSTESEQNLRSQRSSSLSSKAQSPPPTVPAFKSPAKKNAKAVSNKGKKIESTEECEAELPKVKEVESLPTVEELTSPEFMCKICGLNFETKYLSLQHDLSHSKKLILILDRVKVSKVVNCTVEPKPQPSPEKLNKITENNANEDMDVEGNKSLSTEKESSQKPEEVENMEVSVPEIAPIVQDENKEMEVTEEPEKKEAEQETESIPVPTEEKTIVQSTKDTDMTEEVQNNEKNTDDNTHVKETRGRRSKRQSSGTPKRSTRRSKTAEVEKDKCLDETVHTEKSDVQEDEANIDLQNNKNVANVAKENLEMSETPVEEETASDSIAKSNECSKDVDNETVNDVEESETVTQNAVTNEEVENETIEEEMAADEAAVTEAVADEAVAVEAVAVEAVADEAVADEAVADEAVADQAEVEDAAVDEAEVDEAVADEAVADEAVDNEAAADEDVEDEAAVNEAVEDEAIEEEVVQDETAEDGVVAEEAEEDEAVEDENAEDEAAEDAVVEEDVVDEPAMDEAEIGETETSEAMLDDEVGNEEVVEDENMDEREDEEIANEEEVDDTEMNDEVDDVIMNEVVEEEVMSSEAKEDHSSEAIAAIDAFDLNAVESTEMIEAPLPDDDVEHELATSDISDAVCEDEVTKENDGIEEISDQEDEIEEEICENDKDEEDLPETMETDVNEENIAEDDVSNFIAEDDEAMAQETLEELLVSRGLQVVDEIAESVTDEESEREKEVDISSERNSFQGNSVDVENEIEIKISEAEYSEILDVTPATIDDKLNLEIIDGVHIQESRMEEVITEEIHGSEILVETSECGIVHKAGNYIMTSDQPELVDIEDEARVHNLNDGCGEIDDSDSAIVVREVLNEVFNLATTDVQTRLENSVEPISDAEDDIDNEKELLPETLENISREIRSSADMPSLEGVEDDEEVEEIPA